MDIIPLNPRRRRSSVLTPLADVVFLLTIFFMLASSFQSAGVMTLAAAPPVKQAGDEDVLVLRLAGNGVFSLDGQEFGRATLYDELRRRAASRDSGKPVLVLAASAAATGDLVFAFASLGQAGFTNTAAAAEEETQQ